MKLISIVIAATFSSVVFAQMPNVSDATKKVDAAAASADAQTKDATAKVDAKANDASLKGQAIKKALVNLNTASQADLEKVPGIGPARAKAIIDARPYKSVQELTKVKGIKEGMIAKIKPYVTI